MKNKKISTILLIFSSMIICVFIFTMYVFHYYKQISLQSVIAHLVVCINIICTFCGQVLYKFLNVITTPDVTKVIIITAFLMFLFKGTSIDEIIKIIKNIEVKGVKIEMKEIEKTKKKEEKKIEDLKHEEGQNNELIIAHNRIKLMQIIIDNPIMAKWIYKYINRSTRSISIPLNLIPDVISIDVISQVFDYEIKSNSIKLTGIKLDLKPTVIEVFNELINKGIIYPEV